MRIGIYSGSFNPVHVGHVALCDHLLAQQVVDEVWLIRSPLNPFKVEAARTLAPDADREAMLRLAIAEHPGLKVSTIEDDLPRPNYTINTLHVLEERWPEHEFHLIVGADNWLAFDRWRDYEEILTRYHLVVYPRPGYLLDEEARLRLGASALAHVRFVDAPLYDVSSTELRAEMAAGRRPEMIDERVWEYVCEHSLFTLPS